MIDATELAKERVENKRGLEVVHKMLNEVREEIETLPDALSRGRAWIIFLDHICNDGANALHMFVTMKTPELDDNKIFGAFGILKFLHIVLAKDPFVSDPLILLSRMCEEINVSIDNLERGKPAL